MIGWLIDCYRSDNHIVVWLKTLDGKDVRCQYPYQVFIYAHLDAMPDLKAYAISFEVIQKKTYAHCRTVLKIAVPSLDRFEAFVKHLEQITSYRVTLYNADIKPEQSFLYEYDLCPFTKVQAERAQPRIQPFIDEEKAPLKQLDLEVVPGVQIRQEFNFPVRSILFNGEVLKGPEAAVLKEFAALFHAYDPDVVSIHRAYAVVPYLASRLKKHNIAFKFDRWDSRLLKYRGGRSYWSYNQVRYQDYSVRLRGRLLIDRSTMIGSECDLEGIIEMVRLSGTLFQQTVARSFGAVFQSALVRLMVSEGMVIPYKEKPIEPPLSMFHLLKADRGGLTIDPKIGFHQNVAELDFISMFPWLIYNHNISAECILSNEGPFEQVPDLPIKASLKIKGLIPRALKPFIDRRMFYKQNPSEEHSRRARGLKWILVSCYGYLRYREFKLGIPTSHMAICAYARQTLLACVHRAEERGFKVIHGIVDSVYITKDGMTLSDVEDLRRELESLFHIPIACEGIFKWVVFLTSRVDPARALPATYFGVFNDGNIKARGLEVRQRGVPPIIKALQEAVLVIMKDCATMEEIRGRVPQACAYARCLLDELPKMKPSLLTVSLMVSRNTYQHNIPQKIILEKLAARGTHLEPGQSIKFIYADSGPILVEEYQGNPDKKKYKKLFVRALLVVLGPFGFQIKDIKGLMGDNLQLEFDYVAVDISDIYELSSFMLPSVL